MADTLDIDRLKTWIGRQETRVDTITPQLLRAFRAMLDRDPGEPAADEAVPQALHWCLAPPTAPMGEIGPDGHPARGGFLPPVPLPRPHVGRRAVAVRRRPAGRRHGRARSRPSRTWR